MNQNKNNKKMKTLDHFFSVLPSKPNFNSGKYVFQKLCKALTHTFKNMNT